MLSMAFYTLHSCLLPFSVSLTYCLVPFYSYFHLKENKYSVKNCGGGGFSQANVSILHPATPVLPVNSNTTAARLTHPTTQNGGENLFLAGILHFSERQEVEVACEALGDGVPASTWGSHGTGKIDVHYRLECPCRERTGKQKRSSI